MDFVFLSETKLFNGLSAEEAFAAVKCLDGFSKSYSKGEIVFFMGQSTQHLAVVLSGMISIEIDDVWGNKNIMSHINKGEIFAETYSCLPNEKMLVNAVSLENSEILFLNTAKLLNPCENACQFHQCIIKNLLAISSKKNLILSQKIRYTSPKSIRDRLLSYISDQAVKNDTNDFTIPFNRQQLADFLSVDRSAMSNEISKMQRDGFFSCTKNHFILNQKLMQNSDTHTH